MVDPGRAATIPTLRQLLNRRDLAATRHRAGVSRALGLSHTEMLAIAYLAQHGQLMPATLGSWLGISSGAVTALAQRMEAGGHIVREPHPTDGRSILLKLAPTLVERAQSVYSPLIRQLDRLIDDLSERERLTLLGFLERTVDATEREADRLRERIGRRRDAPLPATAPGLWG